MIENGAKRVNYDIFRTLLRNRRSGVRIPMDAPQALRLAIVRQRKPLISILFPLKQPNPLAVFFINNLFPQTFCLGSPENRKIFRKIHMSFINPKVVLLILSAMFFETRYNPFSFPAFSLQIISVLLFKIPFFKSSAVFAVSIYFCNSQFG